MGEIDRTLFDKFKVKFKGDLAQIEQEMSSSTKTLSNSEKFINYSVEICSNINKIWTSGNYDQKTKLQKVVFPDGVVYDREKDDYRTFEVNSIIELIAHQSRLLEDNKKGEVDFLTKLPPLVRGRRLPDTESLIRKLIRVSLSG